MASLTHNMWWSISHVILKTIKCEQLNKLYCISFVRAPTGFMATQCCVLCGRNTARVARAYRGRLQPTAMLPDASTQLQRISDGKECFISYELYKLIRESLCYLSSSTEMLNLKQISPSCVSVFCNIISCWIIQFNSCLFTWKLNSPEVNYRVNTSKRKKQQNNTNKIKTREYT
jgi:hypothetical protein